MAKSKNIYIHKISNKEKHKKIFLRLLSKKSKVYKMIKENEIDEDEIFNIIEAASVSMIFNRNICSASIHSTLLMNPTKNEKEQILREQNRRQVSSEKYTLSMRKYFKKRLTFGPSKVIQNAAIVSEMLSMIKSITLNADKNSFQEQGINLENLMRNLSRNKNEYKNIIWDIIFKCKSDIINKRLEAILNRAVFNIETVNNDVFSIETIHRRKYIPLKKRSEKNNEQS